MASCSGDRSYYSVSRALREFIRVVFAQRMDYEITKGACMTRVAHVTLDNAVVR